MQVLIYYFVKYPLIIAKYSDFLLIKQAFEIIKTKGHLTEKGLLEMIRIKSILNLELSDKLKTAFPNFVPVSRLAFKLNSIPNSFWVADFISGNRSFFLVLKLKLLQLTLTFEE